MPRLSELVRQQAGPSWKTVVAPAAGIGSAVVARRTPNGESHVLRPKAKDQTDWYPVVQQELTNVIEGLRQGTRRDLGELPRMSAGIAAALQENDRLLRLALTGAPREQVIRHSVNVSILATKLAIGAQFHGDQLERLTLGGLLHDVGMFTIPEPLLTKSEPLTTGEWELIEQHPRLGAELIHRLGTPYGWLGQVVLQEHERWGGQGYPNKIQGSAIDPCAQIIGLADLLDTLVSPRPPHRRLLPHEAVRELLVTEKFAFSQATMKALLEQISLYPVGTHVRVNTGAVGVVTTVTPRYPLRPVLQISEGTGGSEEPTVLDLSATTLVHIVEVVGPEDGR